MRKRLLTATDVELVAEGLGITAHTVWRWLRRAQAGGQPGRPRRPGVLDQGIDTSTAIGRMFFQILGSIAEFEHALMSERTMDGLAAARARGRIGGQKPKLGPRQVKMARQMYEETRDDGRRRYTVAAIAAEFGVTRPTIYRHLATSATDSPTA